MRKPFELVVVGGAGRIGLSLALAFSSKGIPTLAYDIAKPVLRRLASGRMPFLEENGDKTLRFSLKKRGLCFSANPRLLKGAATILVAVGTSDDMRDFSRLELTRCVDEILAYAADGALLVICSTLPIGYSDFLRARLDATENSISLAYCPIRTATGHNLSELTSIPQIVSADSPESCRRAAALFRKINRRIVQLTMPEAEAAKLMCNAFRYLQFATANMFYTSLEAMGISFAKVLTAAKAGYPRLASLSRAGLAGGPCLPKDASLFSQLTPARSLMEAALSINRRMPEVIVKELRKRFPLAQMRVGILGMTFKPASDEIRGSLSYELKRLLKKAARSVMCTDPNVRSDPGLATLPETVAGSDLLLIAVPHPLYTQTDFCSKPVINIFEEGFVRADRTEAKWDGASKKRAQRPAAQSKVTNHFVTGTGTASDRV